MIIFLVLCLDTFCLESNLKYMKFIIKTFFTVTFLTCFLFVSCNQKEADSLEPEKVEVVILAETTKSWNGDELPKYLEGQPKVTILKITIPPKTDLAMHEHLVINAGVLIKGELTVTTEDNKVLHMKAGDSIVEVVNNWHYGKNEGDEPAEIIVFYAGIEGIPITVLKDKTTEH